MNIRKQTYVGEKILVKALDDAGELKEYDAVVTEAKDGDIVAYEKTTDITEGDATEMSDDDMTMPFSGERALDLANLWQWLVLIDTRHGLAVEALDCILSKYKEGGTLPECVHFAVCEWDL